MHGLDVGVAVGERVAYGGGVRVTALGGELVGVHVSFVLRLWCCSPALVLRLGAGPFPSLPLMGFRRRRSAGIRGPVVPPGISDQS
ncbi:hypothetical protein SDC9_204349 [bioreactor metagenome]|uniref:Uncharacterized protein n=1 Tax=bioreactor metagenome TaxID=1076179 RepID=A0A645J1S5_9ZZZZ